MASDDAVGAVELLEGMEYRYAWEDVLPSVANLVADPEEIFQPDTGEGKSGRLRPGLATGTIRVVVRAGANTLGMVFRTHSVAPSHRCGADAV
ncbi:hypothetical protein, partial [Ralstonia pseudosolanacearum]|uniref:hypothetical protein n=1 Tax=Ralstonia pseudosolanacearum TaxID=1310165 RepID=UPI0020132D07